MIYKLFNTWNWWENHINIDCCHNVICSLICKTGQCDIYHSIKAKAKSLPADKFLSSHSMYIVILTKLEVQLNASQIGVSVFLCDLSSNLCIHYHICIFMKNNNNNTHTRFNTYILNISSLHWLDQGWGLATKHHLSLAGFSYQTSLLLGQMEQPVPPTWLSSKPAPNYTNKWGWWSRITDKAPDSNFKSWNYSEISTSIARVTLKFPKAQGSTEGKGINKNKNAALVQINNNTTINFKGMWI